MINSKHSGGFRSLRDSDVTEWLCLLDVYGLQLAEHEQCVEFGGDLLAIVA